MLLLLALLLLLLWMGGMGGVIVVPGGNEPILHLILVLAVLCLIFELLPYITWRRGP